jgi:acyl-[acyl-carrier-protein]-phospholipid O-acyltransferase/long-chain-fatty-acid--[acyl-carrier-protein] ligase
MLGNHISWVDWAMVQLASPRPVRFVMERDIYARWYWRRFMDFFGVVPISQARPRDALRAVTGLLENGQVVCLFPEGTMSKNAQLGEFKRGFERAAAAVSKTSGSCILPFYLRGLWGSRFSHASDKLKRGNRGGRPRDVIVAFGPTLPLGASAQRVKQAVFRLSVSSWQEHAASLPSIPSAWIKVAKRHPADTAVIDSHGQRWSNRRLIASVLLVARAIRRRVAGERIGVLLPPGSAAVIVNLAAWLAGKQVVNLDVAADAKTLADVCRRVGVEHVFVSAPRLARLRERTPEEGQMPAGVTSIDFDKLAASQSGWRGLVAVGAAMLLPGSAILALNGCPQRRPDDVATILFSRGSGCTLGQPIEISHRNIVANVAQIVDVLNTESDDVVLANLPLSHAFGLTVTLCLPLLSGVPLACHPDPKDALGGARAIARFRATVLFSTSTQLRRLLEQPKIHPTMLDSLRIVVAGTERLSPAVR